jgi:hypothetical protein
LAALLLYLTTTIALIVAWRRFVQPVSRTAAIVLVLLPLCFTGRALLTDRVYAPIDLPYMSEPLNAYAAEFGVAKAHNATFPISTARSSRGGARYGRPQRAADSRSQAP